MLGKDQKVVKKSAQQVAEEGAQTGFGPWNANGGSEGVRLSGVTNPSLKSPDAQDPKPAQQA